MKDTILIVEDEISLRETLAYNLDKQGYKVITARDGYQALDYARQKKPSLIIMDLMIPGIDGMDVTRILRSETNIPILMLTARSEEIDKILGLEIGADDYITKPFSMRELLTRVKTALRRVRMNQFDHDTEEPKLDVLIIGNLIINQDRHEVKINGQLLDIKPKEYELLLYFAQHIGQVLTRERLLERVWGWQFSGGTRTVDVHIRWLREKIETNPGNPKRLITVRGVGYRFEG